MPSLFLIKDNPNKTDYEAEFMKAVIAAAGGELKSLSGSNELVQRHSDEWFRDALVIIPDKKLILSTSKTDAARQSTQNILSSEISARDPSFQRIETEAYFEGGNVFYLAEHNLLIHGNDAEGHYEDRYGWGYNPRKQTEQLTTDLEDKGIEVLGINLSEEANRAGVPPNDTYGYFRAYYAYHLDCFMQTMPDGRLLIINAKILSPESLQALQDKIGDKLIDLAYEDYLIKPVLLNFVTVPYGDSFRIISNTLPEKIVSKFEELGYSTITPKTFLPISSDYHEGFNETVIKNMRKSGYQGPLSETSLFCHKEETRESLAAMIGTTVEYNLFNPGGHAGLHCLIIDAPNLGKIDENSICHHDLIDTEAKANKISPHDWIEIIAAKNLSIEINIDILSTIIPLYSEHSDQVIILNDIFKNLIASKNIQGRLFYSSPLSIDFLIDFKHKFPDLTAEINDFIEKNLATIFLNSYIRSHTVDIFESLSVSQILDHVSAPEHIGKILEIYCDHYSDDGIKNRQTVHSYVMNNLEQVIHSEKDKEKLCQMFPKKISQINDFKIQRETNTDSTAYFNYLIDESKLTDLVDEAKDIGRSSYSILDLPYARVMPSAATLLSDHRILHREKNWKAALKQAIPKENPDEIDDSSLEGRPK